MYSTCEYTKLVVQNYDILKWSIKVEVHWLNWLHLNQKFMNALLICR